MKIVIVSSGVSGGAGLASYRLHKGLRDKGMQSSLLTASLSIPDEHIYSVEAYFKKNVISRLWFKLKYALLFRKHHKQFIDWSNPGGLINFPVSIWPLHKHPLIRQADIINIHWFGDLIDFPVVFKKLTNQKVVWTLHDMSLFTGGCQYADNCEQYRTGCASCPYTSSRKKLHYYFRLKESVLQGRKNVHRIVALNTWMKQQAESSSIINKIPVEIIYNGIDGFQYRMEEKKNARKKLGLPENKILGMFIAQDLNNERKGGKLLKDCFQDQQPDNFAVVAVGKGKLDITAVDCIYMGEVSSPEVLRTIYSASDFLIHAAVMDNLPNTVAESLLCGRPVIGFKTGGLPDMINQNNGLLLSGISSGILSEGIIKMIEQLNRFDPEVIRTEAVSVFGIEVQIDQYKNLFTRIINH